MRSGSVMRFFVEPRDALELAAGDK